MSRYGTTPLGDPPAGYSVPEPSPIRSPRLLIVILLAFVALILMRILHLTVDSQRLLSSAFAQDAEDIPPARNHLKNWKTSLAGYCYTQFHACLQKCLGVVARSGCAMGCVIRFQVKECSWSAGG